MFAPALQTLSKGTNSPQIFLPFTDGLEYEILTLVPDAKTPVASADGLAGAAD